MKYVFLFHLPGAAGNFVSRCLNLIDNAHCWVDQPSQLMPNDILGKLEVLSYSEVGDRSINRDIWLGYKNWLEWEKRHVTGLNHGDLPADAYLSIDTQHPNYNFKRNDIAGKDDQQYVIYIDASDYFEWCTLNALYKNSFIGVAWLKHAQTMIADPDILKVSLRKIAQSKEGFLEEILKICRFIDHPLMPAERMAMLELHDQWYATQLHPEDFAAFKQLIGWQL
jgi:hypothetical protein